MPVDSKMDSTSSGSQVGDAFRRSVTAVSTLGRLGKPARGATGVLKKARTNSAHLKLFTMKHTASSLAMYSSCRKRYGWRMR